MASATPILRQISPTLVPTSAGLNANAICSSVKRFATGFLFVASSAFADERFNRGRTVFLEKAEPACGLCHTLLEAGTTGEVGPTFESLQPSYDKIMKAITEGIGPMMPYTETLSPEELDALAYYVATAASGG